MSTFVLPTIYLQIPALKVGTNIFSVVLGNNASSNLPYMTLSELAAGTLQIAMDGGGGSAMEAVIINRALTPSEIVSLTSGNGGSGEVQISFASIWTGGDGGSNAEFSATFYKVGPPLENYASTVTIFTLPNVAGFTQTHIDNAVLAATTPLNAQILTLQGNQTTLQNQITTLTGQAVSLTEERDTLQTTATALQAGLLTLQTTNTAQAGHVASLTTQIQGLNADIFQLNQTIATLQQTATIIGFVAAHRTGIYTIKDFTLLNSIERLPNGNFKRRDLDFINTQLLSLGQAAVKMRQLAASADPNLSLQFRARADKMTEYNSRKGGNFGDYLNESARIIEFAVNEIRNNQRFDLTNIQFSKIIL